SARSTSRTSSSTSSWSAASTTASGTGTGTTTATTTGTTDRDGPGRLTEARGDHFHRVSTAGLGHDGRTHASGGAPMADPALSLPDRELALPVVDGTEPPSGLDVSRLLAETGYVTYDPGFVDTAACSSSITVVDGDAGVLRYRGYPIEELAEHSSFLEVSSLLIHGELPTADELVEFTEQVRVHTLLHEDL